MAAWKTWWYPIVASSRKQSTIELSSGESELVAVLSGACEGMGLRQWNWPRQFSNNNEIQTDAAQQILCCDPSAALGMTRRRNNGAQDQK